MPYPVPPYGHIEAGILTLTNVQPTEATRIQLPCPFSWPVRTLNLKRCLDVERIPVENSDKELVLINLHLEAYDKNDENFQYYLIDGFIVSDNVEVEKMETMDYGFLYTDHNPIKMSVRLK